MQEEYLKRWRLILGGDEADGTGVSLSADEARMDDCLEAVYDSDRSAGLGGSAPKVSRWLGDIREFFPQSVVQVIQRDAISRLHLNELLTERRARLQPARWCVGSSMSSSGASLPLPSRL